MKDYDIVLGARGVDRRTALDYINGCVTGFEEFHGDRLYGDDSAVVCGLGLIRDLPVTGIGIENGKDTQDRILHNFGSAKPEGYRKALRLMKHAEKFHRPILCFVDTAGAFCDIDAEEHGQGRAIADNLYEMSDLRTPILSIVIGEGGSGGALALAHADRIWMLDDAYFSVVSPESCSNILWKTTDKSEFAAKSLGLTAKRLHELGLIDRVISEKSYRSLEEAVHKELLDLLGKKTADLVEERYRKFRKIGY
jgi:acetyl-CoA carboxylase carboxyl transferase subunit alpha